MVALVAASALAGTASAQSAPDAASLASRYAALAPQLANNDFQRPLVIESTESPKAVSGNAYAVVNQPFAVVMAAFRDPDTWCEVLILHLNTKQCRAQDGEGPAVLQMAIGKKTPQEIKDAYTLAFDFRVANAGADYLSVQMNADKGPVGTNNYRIQLAAVPVAGGKTFMHLQYSYGYGMAGRIAMQGYLSTMGSGKIGFTQVDRPGGGKAPVEGMRAAVERNTMRYYLAIDAYLASPGAGADALEKRLQHWFDATERYPRQLHEVERTAYLTMKRSEYRRQQAAQ